MAMLPALMSNTIFNDIFDDPFFNRRRDNSRTNGEQVLASNLMSTDVRETEDKYELDIDMPGFAKDDVALHLENQYLIVSAQRKTEDGTQDENGKWIRRERFTGSCSRSFYVGQNVKESDIHAKFENGTLHISVPKASVAPSQTKQTIAIEG